MDFSGVLAAPGVVDVMVADDIVGKNNFGPVVDDDPIFAAGIVEYVGQALFAVAAETVEQARRAAKLACIDYEDLPPILDIRQAIESDSFVLPSETINPWRQRQGN